MEKPGPRATLSVLFRGAIIGRARTGGESFGKVSRALDGWKLNDSISVCFATGISMDRCLCLARKRELVNGQNSEIKFDRSCSTMVTRRSFSNEKMAGNSNK